MECVRADAAGLERTAAILNAGGVAVIPTDTVYGLAAHPDFPDAVARLYTIKARAAHKPIALLAADAAAAERFLGGLDDAARAAAAWHWPGALTLVLPVRRASAAPGAYEGLRVPDHAWTRRLLAACGGVLRVTSANMSGRRAATDAQEALAAVGLSADVTVDDGVSPGGAASTVARPDAATGTFAVLRDGPVVCWRVIRLGRTESTNRDACAGTPGDVFVAEEQTAGRGRLDHRWYARPGENLTFSAVIDVAGLDAAVRATLPLVAGLAVAEALADVLGSPAGLAVKWPNDVLLGGRKICGCLCELTDAGAIVGLGINVNQRRWTEDLRRPATSLAAAAGHDFDREAVMRRVLTALAARVFPWRREGFAPIRAALAAFDALKGLPVEVHPTDAGGACVRGLCGGIAEDGALLVAGERIYAGEARTVTGTDFVL